MLQGNERFTFPVSKAPAKLTCHISSEPPKPWNSAHTSPGVSVPPGLPMLGAQWHPTRPPAPSPDTHSSTADPTSALQRCHGHPWASQEEPEDAGSWTEPFTHYPAPNPPIWKLWNSWHLKEYHNLSAHCRQSPRLSHLSNLPPASFTSLVPTWEERGFPCSHSSCHLQLTDLSQLFLSQPGPFHAMSLFRTYSRSFSILVPLCCVFSTSAEAFSDDQL